MKKESDLADIVIKHFEKDNYEIYSEVIYKSGSKRADIVAVKNNEYIVIETKMSMNMTLLEQGYFWKDKVHKVYICCPSKRKLNRFALQVCRDLGIGIYIYRKNKLVLMNDSTICSDPDLPKLHEQQKDSISGSKGGGFVTPFRLTREKLVKYITENGNSSLHSAIKNIDHHYSSIYSAKNALHKMINTNVITELNIFRKGKEVWIKLS
tara:strand:- start:66704 stop:67330 length:627 start_codon:yes stop_codon:yes gene_type:complete